MNMSSERAVQRRRFWHIVLGFVVANAITWVVYDRTLGRPSRDVLRVDRFSPGERAIVRGGEALRWTFNLDMAQTPGIKPATVTPAVAGDWRWSDARTLLFTPKDELPRGTKVVFTLNPESLHAVEGFYLARPFVSTVLSAPLELFGLRQSGLQPNDQYLLEFTFSDRILPADVAGHVKLFDVERRPIKFEVQGQSVDHILRILTDPVSSTSDPAKNASISVHVDEGLAGVGGQLGLQQAFEQTIPLSKSLSVTGATAEAPRRDEAPSIHLQLNGPTDLEALRQIVSIEPAVKIELQSRGSDCVITGDLVPGTRYAVKIAEAPAGADRRKYPRVGMVSVFVPDRRKSAWFEHDEGYLGSAGNRAVQAHAVNVSELKISVWRVYDSNLVAWRNGDDGRAWRMSGYSKPIASRRIKVDGQKNVIQDIRIELDDLLGESEGRDGVYRIELQEAKSVTAGRRVSDEDSEEEYDDYYDSYAARDSAVVSLSDIALTAKHTHDGLLVWTTSLSQGKPLAGLRIRAYSNKNQLLGESLSDENGIARLEHLNPAAEEHIAVVLADRVALPTTQPSLATTQSASGLTWLDLSTSDWNTSDLDISGRKYLRTGCEAFVWTERGVYRPGETVYLRALVRRSGESIPTGFPVKFQIKRPDLREWRNLVVKLDDDGSAAWQVQLPSDLVTGRWTAEIGLPGENGSIGEIFGSVTFAVEEYLPDRLKTSIQFENISEKEEYLGARWTIGDQPLVTAVQADYLFGRPAAGLRAILSGRVDAAPFAPSRWSGWTFGDGAKLIELPGMSSVGSLRIRRPGASDVGRQELMLDEKGHGTWSMDLRRMLELESGDGPPRETDRFLGPWRLSVMGSVTDSGGRAVSAGNNVSLDVLPYYIGIHSLGSLSPNKPQRVELALVNPRGNLEAIDAKLEPTLWRANWNTSLVYRQGRFQYVSDRILDPVKNTPAEITVKEGRAVIDLLAPTAGQYVLRLRDRSTGAMTSVQFYASDGGGWVDNINRDNPERLQLAFLAPAPPTTLPSTAPVLDAVAAPSESGARHFAIGEAARVLVRSPFAGQLLLTVETDEITSVRVIDMPAPSMEVPIEVTPAMYPNAYVTASVIRAVEPDQPWRTHRACGSLRLSVDPGERRLTTSIIAPAEIRPDRSMEVQVQVSDLSGQPVQNAAVIVTAVDEGILQLTNYKSPDPLSYFAATRALSVQSSDIYSQLMPEVPKADKVGRVGGDREGDGRYQTPVVARRVKPVSLISEVRTDEHGVAVAHFEVPAFTGKLRVMAVAYARTSYGSGEQDVLVRSPLLVQSSFPRFAAPGDAFSVPVALFNNSSTDGSVTLEVELLNADNPFVFSHPPTQGDRKLTLSPIVIKAGGQATTSFDLTAAQQAGIAQVRVKATMGDEQYEETIELPVRPAAPRITRGGYAIAKPNQNATLNIPDDFLPGTQSLEVAISQWPTMQLPEGLEYLERYPYGCCEQTISTTFPMIYLSDVGERIAPGVFDRERVADKVKSGIVRLMGMQTVDGGLAMWPGNTKSWPWASVYGAHFIVEAEQGGHAVPEDFHRRLLSYVRHLLDRGGDDGELVEVQAYACYVLALEGKPDRAAMNRLQELVTAKTLAPDSMEAMGSAKLYLALAQFMSGRRDLANSLIPQELPKPRSSRKTGGNLGSPVRDRALLLMAMLTIEPDHPALPDLAQQLADSGVKREWRSTQDCAFAVMALGKFLRQTTSPAPYETASMKLGEQMLAETPKGEMLRWNGLSPIVNPSAPGAPFVFQITGAPDARGYVRWLESGVPLTPPPDADYAVKVRRTYLDEDNLPLELANVRSGQLVQVELTIESVDALENLVVEDLLPAGLEIENPRLATTAAAIEEANPDPADRDQLRAFNCQRLDVRDDRLVLFGQTPGGTVRWQYLARVLAPGTYVVPPVRVECMYDLSINSISGGGGSMHVAAH